MMERNFNLTYPVADWFFGTSDLECGLLKHVFNGYDTSKVRGDVRAGGAAMSAPRAALKPEKASLIGGIVVGIASMVLWVAVTRELGFHGAVTLGAGSGRRRGGHLDPAGRSLISRLENRRDRTMIS